MATFECVAREVARDRGRSCEGAGFGIDDPLTLVRQVLEVPGEGCGSARGVVHARNCSWHSGQGPCEALEGSRRLEVARESPALGRRKPLFPCHPRSSSSASPPPVTCHDMGMG